MNAAPKHAAADLRPLRDPAAVRAWVAPLLDRAYAAAPGPLPLAGSRAWVELDHGDPRKLAAVFLAALVELEDSTPQAIAARLAAEWASAQRLVADSHKQVAAAISGAADWRKVADNHVPFCVVAARRTTYTTPAKTPDQIRADAVTSWGFQQRRAAA
ncbi:DUF2742 domain-containing protein [Crossiella sp. CA198]|uniref:DUF2742 domain-containing protein n=1 Tax=Crossiella sp. CA198 TaxID=3455607 RepID=UPI003F8D2D8F